MGSFKKSMALTSEKARRLIFTLTLVSFFLGLILGYNKISIFPKKESGDFSNLQQQGLSILILFRKNPPYLFRDTNWESLESFDYGYDTEVWSSASTILMGKMWIFGGRENGRQLLSVGKCGLKYEGTLPFDFSRGAANTVGPLNSTQSALLCFDMFSPNTCHSFDGSDFKVAASSICNHSSITLGKIEEGLVAVGGNEVATGEREVELYTDGHWVQQPPFPKDRSVFTSDIFYDYPVATYENVLYVFGGWDFWGPLQSVHLGRMTKLGLESNRGPDLLLSRSDHRSIAVGNEIYHIGGNKEIEKWTIKANEITTELFDLVVENGYWTPEIFLVNYA